MIHLLNASLWGTPLSLCLTNSIWEECSRPASLTLSKGVGSSVGAAACANKMRFINRP